MPCRDCYFWKPISDYADYGVNGIGTCANENMQTQWVPYTQKPHSFPGTQDEFNTLSRPPLRFLTTPDFSCPEFARLH